MKYQSIEYAKWYIANCDFQPLKELLVWLVDKDISVNTPKNSAINKATTALMKLKESTIGFMPRAFSQITVHTFLEHFLENPETLCRIIMDDYDTFVGVNNNQECNWVRTSVLDIIKFLVKETKNEAEF